MGGLQFRSRASCKRPSIPGGNVCWGWQRGLGWGALRQLGSSALLNP